MGRRRAAGWLGLVLLAGCTVAGPEPSPGAPEASPSPATTPDAGGGTLRVGLSASPTSLDPRFVADAEGELIVDAVFEPLVRLDAQQRVQPAAAHDWTADDDGRTWTFHLREDATFHDGSPVTAADFERSFTRIADGTAEPTSHLAYLLDPVQGIDQARAQGGPLRGVEALDPHTLRLRLRRPEPGFVRTLTHPSLAPVPAQADDEASFAALPVGNGPFAVAEPFEPGGFVRLARVPDHHAEPRLEAIVFQFYPDDLAGSEQWGDLLDGQLHVAEVAHSRIAEAVDEYGRSADGYRGPGLLSGRTATVYLYGFDTTRPPYDDPAVRRAVSLAIDRDRIAEEVFSGARTAATAIVPPPVSGAQPGVCGHCRHDPARAREVLADADAELEELTLTFNRGSTHAAVAQAMAADIEQALGVAVSVEALDLQAFLTAVRDGEAGFFRLGLDPDRPDPQGYLFPLLHSSAIGVENLTRYADEEVDELLEAARAVAGESAVERWRQAEQRALEDVAVVPLLGYRHSQLVAPGVRDLYWSPYGRIDFARVWLEEP